MGLCGPSSTEPQEDDGPSGSDNSMLNSGRFSWMLGGGGLSLGKDFHGATVPPSFKDLCQLGLPASWWKPWS